jgi:hypothetical protein
VRRPAFLACLDVVMLRCDLAPTPIHGDYAERGDKVD